MPAPSDRVVLACIAAMVIAADQVSKAAVISAIGPGRAAARIEVIGPWMAIEYAENRGVAFGVLASLGPLLLLAAGIVLAGLLVHYLRTPSPPFWQTFSIGLVVGGAIGNLLDRARLGYVVDFVAVGAWPNFNVADSAICIGVIVMVWGWLRAERYGSAARAS